jgi:hypothetical protein
MDKNEYINECVSRKLYKNDKMPRARHPLSGAVQNLKTVGVTLEFPSVDVTLEFPCTPAPLTRQFGSILLECINENGG